MRLLTAAPVAALAAALAFGGSPAVQAAPGSSAGQQAAVAAPEKPAKKKPALKVMTQNLYLGASLDPALEADGDMSALLAAINEIYNGAMASDFPTRASHLADTIAAQKPHLIGIQEATRWTAGVGADGPEVAPPSQDFLAILVAELEERGLSYTAHEVLNAKIGPAPLVDPARGCTEIFTGCNVMLEDRDVILVADGVKGLKMGKVRTGRYKVQETFSGGPLGELSFGRGWVSVDGTYKGAKFRMLNTHLEIGRFAKTQVKQAREFLAGPAKTGKKKQLIATGDFNSAADGSSTRSYKILTKQLADVWTQANGKAAGNTCCQDPDLANLVPDLHERIDLILTRGTRPTKWAKVVGDQPYNTDEAFVGPRYAADHAGVVAKVRLR